MTAAGAAPATVCVFAASPLLMVSIENRSDGEADVHVHAGGQGPWIANMVAVLGAQAVLCGPFGGENGGLVQQLAARDGVAVRAVPSRTGNGCYVEDRRSGELSCVAETHPGVLDRHEIDSLFNELLAAALTSRVTVLTGPVAGSSIEPDDYRRLTRDLAALDVTVAADLSGDTLAGALDGGLAVLKVSHEELLAAGQADSEAPEDLVRGLRALGERVSRLVVLTRGAEPALALLEDTVVEVQVPQLQPVHHRGAGDSMTAGVAAALAAGADLRQALRLGAAAGVVNVTRHGLASGERETIERVAERVTVAPWKPEQGDGS